jgi:hypothetical protein
VVVIFIILGEQQQATQPASSKVEEEQQRKNKVNWPKINFTTTSHLFISQENDPKNISFAYHSSAKIQVFS